MPKSTKRSDAIADGKNEFIVEKLLGKRIRNGRIEYLIRWQGYGEADDAWSLTKDISPALIKLYEDEKKKSDIKKKDEKLRGFDRGLAPEKIIGATDSTGELTFLIKWTGIEEADLVPATIANERCPQTVIKFYEDRLTWRSHPIG